MTREDYVIDADAGATAATGTTLISESDVQAVLNIEDAIRVVERTYVEINRDRVLNPAKLSMHMGDDGNWPDRNAFAIDMPAYVDWCDAVGMKWAVAAWDADTEVPISSLILLFDLDAGRFKSVMEGMHLTGVRTALQSAVGLKHLLSTRPDSVGILGAGFQAKFQLLVIDKLLDVSTFYIYDTNADTATDLREQLTDRIDADIVIGDTPEVVDGTDAVLTVTDSKHPVVTENLVADAELVIALGSYRELPDETIDNADTIVVDHVEQCLCRGALADMVRRDELSASDIDATIGEVLDGNADDPVCDGDRTVFVPIGLGALDIAMAERVYRTTNTEGITKFKFK